MLQCAFIQVIVLYVSSYYSSVCIVCIIIIQLFVLGVESEKVHKSIVWANRYPATLNDTVSDWLCFIDFKVLLSEYQ